MHESFFIKQYTDNGFDISEARNEINFVLDIVFNYSAKDFIIGKKLSKEEMLCLDKIVKERIKTRQPIQQIVGSAFFYGKKFYVNKNTLIPRPETEILVYEVLKYSKEYQNPKILDIGTGTGCIPIILAIENTDIIIHSVDISEDALTIARKNAALHKTGNRIKFFKSDLFSNVTEQYNIIVSNPPYIPIKDKNSLQKEVRDFDPPLALFANDKDGIEFYQKIIHSASDYLLDSGKLFFEIGINQSELIRNILIDYRFNNIKVIKDLNNTDRVIIAQKE